jgi:hypothetical protein
MTLNWKIKKINLNILEFSGKSSIPKCPYEFKCFMQPFIVFVHFPMALQNITVSMSMLSGDKEPEWQLFRIQEI